MQLHCHCACYSLSLSLLLHIGPILLPISLQTTHKLSRAVFPTSIFPFRLKSRYSPWRPVLCHHHSILFFQCDRPRFAPMPNRKERTTEGAVHVTHRLRSRRIAQLTCFLFIKSKSEGKLLVNTVAALVFS